MSSVVVEREVRVEGNVEADSLTSTCEEVEVMRKVEVSLDRHFTMLM